MANTPDPRARRFREYVERLTVALGHADRREPMRAYLTGLCLPGERKSIEPMAARIDPRHVRARHQSMHHFVANAPWDGAAILRVARDWVLGPMARHGPVAAWIVLEASDDLTQSGQPRLHESAVAHRCVRDRLWKIRQPSIDPGAIAKRRHQVASPVRRQRHLDPLGPLVEQFELEVRAPSP